MIFGDSLTAVNLATAVNVKGEKRLKRIIQRIIWKLDTIEEAKIFDIRSHKNKKAHQKTNKATYLDKGVLIKMKTL